MTESCSFTNRIGEPEIGETYWSDSCLLLVSSKPTQMINEPTANTSVVHHGIQSEPTQTHPGREFASTTSRRIEPRKNTWEIFIIVIHLQALISTITSMNRYGHSSNTSRNLAGQTHSDSDNLLWAAPTHLPKVLWPIEQTYALDLRTSLGSLECAGL